MYVPMSSKPLSGIYFRHMTNRYRIMLDPLSGRWVTCTATVVAALLLLQERTLDKLSMLVPHELERATRSPSRLAYSTRSRATV